VDFLLRVDGRDQNITIEPIQGLRGLSLCGSAVPYTRTMSRKGVPKRDGPALNLNWALPLFAHPVPRQPNMSARSTPSRLSVLWAILGLALVRLVTGRGSTHHGPSNSVPDRNLLVSEEQRAPLTAELMERNWRAFLKRDVGWLFGTLYLLAMMQAAFFAYDQILNDSALETAAVDAISHQWQRLRSR
jgi:hypothetical protein